MEYRVVLFEIAKLFQAICHGCFGTKSTATHLHEQASPYILPTILAPYSTGPKEQESEKEDIDAMLKETVTDPAQTEWASHVVFLPKKYGPLRFCVVYQKINYVTVREFYPHQE